MKLLERVYAAVKYVLLPIAAGMFAGACLQFYLVAL